jgi:YVTN family beta-propeller protein
MNTATNTVVDTMIVGIVHAGVAAHQDGSSVYVTNQTCSTVSVIDTKTNTVVDTVTIGNVPRAVAVHPDGSAVYAANVRSNTVLVIDTRTTTVVGTVTVGDGPWAFGKFIGPILNSLTISPPSGTYVLSQAFDLTLIAKSESLSVTGGATTLDGVDVSGFLENCVVPGTLISGGQTFRCPSITGELLTEDKYTLSATLALSGGSTVSDSVTWDVAANSEP